MPAIVEGVRVCIDACGGSDVSPGLGGLSLGGGSSGGFRAHAHGLPWKLISRDGEFWYTLE